MGEDIKSLGKKIYDIEKRLKFNEAKIKVLADSMTKSKDIENYLDVLYKKMGRDLAESEKLSQKLQNRQIEMSERAREAIDKERDREWDKESKLMQKEYDKFNKEMAKMTKDSVRQAEMSGILARLEALEKVVSALSKK